MNKPRLLFYCPYDLSFFGGVQYLLTRSIDILKNRCEIILLLTSLPNWNLVNSMYQSHLSKDDMKVVIVKPVSLWLKFWRLCFNCYAPDPTLWLEARDCDLCVGFSNYSYFGKPAIHFVADVDMADMIGIKGPRGPRHTHWIPPHSYFKDRIRAKYKRWGDFAKMGFRAMFGCQKRLRKALLKNGDHIVTNSQWVASFFKKENFPVDFLYPPVVAEFHHVSLTERFADFVCIGRINEHKRIEMMIEILAAVRKKSGREFQFHIAGYLTDQPYSRYVKELASHYPWVKLEGPMFGEEKEYLLTSCRYAIHACEFEAFGISVAEYLKAGCVPFVPSEGGGAEIVGRSELCYTDFEDAVEKILNFLEKDDALQVELQTQLLERGRSFALKIFDKNLTTFFEGELARRGFTGVLRSEEYN